MKTKCPKCGFEFNPELANLREMVVAKYGEKYVEEMEKTLAGDKTK